MVIRPVTKKGARLGQIPRHLYPYHVCGTVGGAVMKGTWGVLARRGSLAMLAVAAAALPLALAQGPYTYNEREVRSNASALDKAGVWTLDFRFKDPRLIKV